MKAEDNNDIEKHCLFDKTSLRTSRFSLYRFGSKISNSFCGFNCTTAGNASWKFQDSSDIQFTCNVL